MQNDKRYKPKFDSVAVLQRAVKRVIRRRKAMGQYITIAERGQVKRMDFSQDIGRQTK